MHLDPMKTQSKYSFMLFTINVPFLIYFLNYFYENNNKLFIALIVFLSVERFFNYMKNFFMIQMGFQRLKRSMIYLVLCLTYLDWRGLGFTHDDYLEYDEYTFHVNAKKHAQFLNSLPLLLIFYNLCEQQPSQNVSIVFSIFIIYISLYTGYLIALRKFQQKYDSGFKLGLYFLINSSAMMSYWGLLGQMIYFNIYFLVAFLSIVFLFTFYQVRNDFCVGVFQSWKLIFLVKHVDNLSFFDLPKYRHQQLYQACMMSVIHIFLIAFKIASFRYINGFDIFLYIGSSFKIIDVVFQFKNLILYLKYGPFEYYKENILNKQNIQKEIQMLQQSKYLKYVNIQFNLVNENLQSMQQEIYRELAKYLQQIKCPINLRLKQNDFMINIHQSQQNSLMITGYQVDFHLIIEFSLKISQNFQPNPQRVISMYRNNHLLSQEELDILLYKTALNFLEQPLNAILKVENQEVQFIKDFSSDLSQFLNLTIPLEKQVFPLININPSLILYDLYEDQ